MVYLSTPHHTVASNLPTALVVDDEAPLRTILRRALEAHGYAVREAETGREGLTQAAFCHPDIVVLDLGLKDLDGLVVLQRLREWSKVPVLVLSVTDHESVKVGAFQQGADDYVTKPFSVAELMARLQAIRNRRPANEPIPLHLGRLHIDFVLRTVSVAEHPLKLTPIEYNLLRLLAQNTGRVITQAHILKTVWGPQAPEQADYLRVHIASLRKKLGNPQICGIQIRTEPRIGYRLVTT